MSDTFDRPIRKFSPGMYQSDEEVVRQFVVRHGELDIVLEVIRGNVDAFSYQHVLVVAPRGRGKTMLLARVCAELRMDNALSRHLFPVRFMEESQEIASLADFWHEALFYLAKATAAGNREFSHELLATHADLAARWPDTNIEEQVLAAVLAAADRMGTTLVLMVENLQSLCNDVDADFGWKLRKTLQTEPRIMLLATATSHFKRLDDATQPFFELFRVINLEPLDTDACQRLWSMASGDARKTREIQPLRILTGGCPRLLVIVAQFAQHGSLRHLLEDLVSLVDDHTEYFRSHLEVIAKTERRVYLAVLDLWQPSSPSEIAVRARMDIRTVSVMLGRLVNRGAVLVDGKGRKRQYSASARLYSIYYKLRRERDEAALVQHLIQFMIVFYSDDEWTEIAETLLLEARQAPAIREGFERALAAGVPLAAGFGVGEPPEIQKMLAKALLDKGITHGQRDEIESELDAYDNLIARFGDSDAPELQEQVARALFNKGVRHGQRGEIESELAAYDNLIARFGDSDAPELLERVAKAILNKGVTHGQRGEIESELDAYDNLIARFGDSDAPELLDGVAKALLNKGVRHGQRGEIESELDAYDNLIARFSDSDAPELLDGVAKALLNKGVRHGQRGEIESELDAYDNLVARFGDSDAAELQEQVAGALLNKGITHGQRGEIESELGAYDNLIARFSGSDAPELLERVAKALLNKGVTHGQRGEIESELDAYDNLVARFGDSDAAELQEQVAGALLNKGITHGQRGEIESELGAYDNLIARFSGSDAPELLERVAKALLNKGVRHGQRGEIESELDAYDNLIARFSDSDKPVLQVLVANALIMRGDRQIAIGRAEEALRIGDEVERRFGAFSENEQIVLALWRAKLLRTHALLVQEKRPSALGVFRSVCSMFVAGNEAMLHEMQIRVPALIAAGATARELGEILSADKKTADALAPLVVALRQMAGESVRAPAEVLEVAADVRKRIEDWPRTDRS